MAGTITDWPLTLEQFLSLPEAKPALEMGCDGEITQKVSPTTEHAILQRELMARFESHATDGHLGHAFPEQRIIRTLSRALGWSCWLTRSASA